MRWRDAVRAIPARLQRPAIWGTCLAWLVLSKTLYLATQFRAEWHAFGPLVPLARLLSALFDPAIVAVLGPLAWQWTGDERPLAPLGRSLVQVMLLTTLSCLVLKVPTGALIPSSPLANSDPLGMASNVLAVLGVFLVAAAVGGAIAWGEHLEQVRRLALSKAQEAQWTLLRSQLSPHLVLNVLNGLAGLAEENPAKAAQGLEDLAEVYGQLLELGEVERIPLARERELLQRYLAVEQVRLEGALHVSWRWDSALDHLEVPPLLLQPLVENAIKHGINASADGGKLAIRAAMAAPMVILEVSNTGGALHLKSAQAGSGVGIHNLKRRLELTYGDRATLSLTEDGAWTRATLCLPATLPRHRGGPA